ncbi:hypothetical protein NXX56_09590 [Bacteroides thetaiotaomicron]|nr:hypothetical protein [Bacteroides thetaiotaomicron]
MNRRPALFLPIPDKCRFLFGLQQDDASVVQTRGSKPEQITRMWYAIANERGEIIKPLISEAGRKLLKIDYRRIEYGGIIQSFFWLLRARKKMRLLKNPKNCPMTG